MGHTTRSTATLFSIFLLLFSFFGTIHPFTATAEDIPAKSVAVLPFAMHAPSSMAYMQEGLRDMLASRLAVDRKSVV